MVIHVDATVTAASRSMPLRPRILGAIATCALLACGCAGPLSALDPAGPQAQGIAHLGWLMFGLSIVVTGLVVALIGWALWRGRRRRDPAEPPPVPPLALIIGGGVALPLMLIALLWVLSLQQLATLAGPPRPAQLEIDVTGRQFSYAVSYAGTNVTLTDEIRIPAGEPVLLRLHSEDVIHSFWVPRLGGKMDLVPGQVNQMWLEASQPGNYQGRCAEFCGIGHTQMSIVVVALDPADFEAWFSAAAAAEGTR